MLFELLAVAAFNVALLELSNGVVILAPVVGFGVVAAVAVGHMIL